MDPAPDVVVRPLGLHRLPLLNAQPQTGARQAGGDRFPKRHHASALIVPHVPACVSSVVVSHGLVADDPPRPA